MAKFDLTRKSTWRKIISVGLALLLSAGAIFGVVAISKKMKEETKKVNPSWETGTINETTGKGTSASKTSLITPETFKAYGLEIEVDFESSAKYQIFYYDNVGSLVSKTEELDEGGEFKVPFDCMVRVELIPDLTNDDDGKISWLEKIKYSSQIEIRVKKNQTLEAKDFADVALTDTSVFEVKAGQTVNLDNAEESWIEASNMTTYKMTNDGEYSAFYVKNFSIGSKATNFLIRMKDGTKVYYYGYDVATAGPRAQEQALPMKPGDAVAFPEGATLYILSSFDEGDAAKTIIGLY